MSKHFRGGAGETTGSEKVSIVAIIMQVIIGLVITLVIYWISIFVLKSDSLYGDATSDPNKKTKVSILPGYSESSQISYNSYNTVTMYAPTYIPLNPSSNIKGGAQFTYSFWMNIGNPSAAVNKPIFLRGDSTKYSYNVTDTLINGTKGVVDYVAFCPLFEFGANPMEFNVRFNTTNNINEVLHITQVHSSNSIYRKNLLSLLQAKWFLISIVFEDNTPINDFENGVTVKFYVNDVLYQSGTYSATLKQNMGNLFMFPSGSIDQCKISVFEYYNYALGLQDVQAKYNAGPSLTMSTTPNSSAKNAAISSPLQLSAYNVLDIYNN